jgi:1-deoxy-D-xylulose-5-phosphate reductoisomerase
MRSLAILGSTGSIGTQTLDVVRAHPMELRVVALSARRSVSLLVEQALEFRPEVVAVEDARGAEEARAALPGSIRVLSGPSGPTELAAWPSADTVVIAISGAAALGPTLAAIREEKRVAFAAKEPLVAAGELIVGEARRRGVELLPIDSEISALFQVMHGERVENVERLILTASGGPFRALPAEELAQVTLARALRHPNWSMGAKITIDSATMMNKGLEVIEAQRLFGVELDRVTILVHPQSIIHSMVEFVDGSTKAQLACPDMRLPIQYAVLYPERLANPFDRLDFATAGRLDFEAPDPVRFPCIRLAFDAARVGGTMTAVLNAANEAAVAAFLGEQIGFADIARLVEGAMERHEPVAEPDLAAILAADQAARRDVEQQLAGAPR